MRYALLWTAVAVATFITSGACGQAVDLIQPTKGAPLRGRIRAITPTEVKIVVNSVERSIPVSEIKFLALQDEPSELKQARRSILSGNYEVALSKLRTINPTSIRSATVRREVEFYQALITSRLALAGSADAKQAARQMLDFKKSSEQSHHHFEAVEVLGQLAMMIGQYQHAEGFFRELSQAPWPVYSMKAGLLEAQALMLQQQFAKARQRFDKVHKIQLAGSDADRQKALAQIGVAQCLAELDQPDEAIRLAEEIIKFTEQSDDELHAKAFNTLGKSYLQQGKTKDALLAFLHTDLLYHAQRDAHAEALYYLIELWDESDKKDRALQARSLLKGRYGHSVWAKQL